MADHRPSLAVRLVRGCGRALLVLFLFLLLCLAVIVALVDRESWTVAFFCMGLTLLGIVLHEAGHLLAGRLVGFRFLFVTIGRLKLSRPGERLRLSLVKGRMPMSGLAGIFPTDTCNLPRRLSIVLAAGPLVNLLLATIGVAGLLVMGFPEGDAEPLGTARVFWLSLAATSTVLLLGTLLPVRMYGVPTDGAKLVELRRGGPEAERHCALMMITGLSLGGRRPREWPASLVETALAVPDGSSFDATAALIAYSWALDREEIAAAESFLDRAHTAKEISPRLLWPVVCLEAAYFTARHRGDAAAARQYLKQSRSAVLLEPYPHLRSEAAVLLAEGEYKTANTRAEEGLAAIRRLGDPDRARDEVDMLHEIAALATAKEPFPPHAGSSAE